MAGLSTILGKLSTLLATFFMELTLVLLKAYQIINGFFDYFKVGQRGLYQSDVHWSLQKTILHNSHYFWTLSFNNFNIKLF